MNRRAAVLLVAVLCSGCGGAAGSADEVTVFAAASLTEAFTEIGNAYENAHPDRKTTFSFAASSELAAQLAEGAPADVYASADVTNMDKVVDLVDRSPAVFATNTAVIVVESGNPLDIGSVDDLADDDLVLVMCAPEVPCGSYADQVFENSGVAVTPDSYEENVKAVVTKVTLGEADAGIAYATDAAATDGVDSVPIADDLNIVADYPIAALAEAPNPDGAAGFVEFVQSDTGQAILADHGFGPP